MSVEVVVIPPADADVFLEGPHWDPSTQSLLYVDVVHNKVGRWDSLRGVNQTLSLKTPSFASVIIPRENGGYVVTTAKQVCHLDWESNTLTPLGDLSAQESEENNRFNDGKCDSRGRLWAGTCPAVNDLDQMPMEKGSLFSVEKGVVKKHVDKINMSNGLAWTSDERTLFYVDSLARHIMAFDFDVANGELSNRHVAISFPVDSTPPLGLPDGMAIDTDGKLWVACMTAGKITRFDPSTGKALRTIEFPVKGVTSCCFGGKNMDELYVTTARLESLGEDAKGRVPLPGALFKVTGLGVKGHLANIYRG